jgi:hypothetical protein
MQCIRYGTHYLRLRARFGTTTQDPREAASLLGPSMWLQPCGQDSSHFRAIALTMPQKSLRQIQDMVVPLRPTVESVTMQDAETKTSWTDTDGQCSAPGPHHLSLALASLLHVYTTKIWDFTKQIRKPYQNNPEFFCFERLLDCSSSSTYTHISERSNPFGCTTGPPPPPRIYFFIGAVESWVRVGLLKSRN